MLRGSAARVAPADDRGPAGEELGGRGDREPVRLLRQGDGAGERATPPEEPPELSDTLHRARAGGREATPVGREAATPATGA